MLIIINPLLISSKEHIMTRTIHPNHDHVHGEGCGHTAIVHDDHVDYLHDGHLHHQHGDHCDDHGAIEVVA